MTAIRDALLGSLLDAWGVLLPVTCVGCGIADRALCAACRHQLAPSIAWHSLADGTPVVSALDYRGVARNALLLYKEQGRTDVARALATPLRSAMAAALSGSGCSRAELVSIPPSRSSYRRRGYDPVGLLLRQAGFRASTRVLVHRRRTEQQKVLNLQSRSQNLAGSLWATRPLNGRTFLLVDDIMTTGSTLSEAARAVRDGGGEVAAAVTLAYTERLFATHRTH